MAEITGQIKGAYREEGFILDNSGNPVGLVEILNMILDGGADVNANNGLNVDEGVIQLGGELVENTVVGQNDDFTLKIGKEAPNDNHYFLMDPAGKISTMIHETATHLGFQGQQATGWGYSAQTKSTGNNGTLTVGHDLIDITVSDQVTPNLTGFYIGQNYLAGLGIRTYASVVAAQADITAPTGTIYRLDGDSVLRIKTL